MTEIVSLDQKRADKVVQEDEWAGQPRKDYIIAMLRKAADELEAEAEEPAYSLLVVGYEYDASEGYRTWHSPMSEAEYYARLSVLRRMAEDELLDGN